MNEEIFVEVVFWFFAIIGGCGAILVGCVGFYRLLEILSEIRKKRNSKENEEKEIKKYGSI